MQHETEKMCEFEGDKVSNEEETRTVSIDGKNCLAVIAEAYSSSEDETSADTRLIAESNIIGNKMDTNDFVNVGVNLGSVREESTALEEQNNSLNRVSSPGTAPQSKLTVGPKSDAFMLSEPGSDGCSLGLKESDSQLVLKVLSNKDYVIAPSGDDNIPLYPKKDDHALPQPKRCEDVLKIKPKDNEYTVDESIDRRHTSVEEQDGGQSFLMSNDVPSVATESGEQTVAEPDDMRDVDTPEESQRDQCRILELEQHGHFATNHDGNTCHQVYTMSSIDKELEIICEAGSTVQTKEHAQDPTAVHSSSSDSSSDEESSSSESSESSSDDDLEDIRKEIEKEEDRTYVGPLKTRSELSVKDLPEVPDVDITVDENVQLVELGVVFSVVESLVVVKALPQTPALDSDSALFLENRSCLGVVFETFGPVQTPFYSVRFNNEADIDKRNIHVGDKVFYAPDMMEYSNFVFVAQLKKLKGSDASWEHDEEPPVEAVEFSDDEEEAKAKASKKKERMAKKGPPADVDKASNTESERNIQQGSNRGGRKRTWQNRGRGKPANQSQDGGNFATCPRRPFPPARGTLPLRAPPQMGLRPSLLAGNPYMHHPPQGPQQLIMGHTGLYAGLPPRGPSQRGPFMPQPMGPSPDTYPGLMGNVPLPQFGTPRPSISQLIPTGLPPGFAPRHVIPGPADPYDYRANVGLQARNAGFPISSPSPPTLPPNL